LVLKPSFFKKDEGFVTVGSGPEIEIDHGRLSLQNLFICMNSSLPRS
jgi:hypothetical protein